MCLGVLTMRLCHIYARLDLFHLQIFNRILCVPIQSCDFLIHLFAPFYTAQEGKTALDFAARFGRHHVALLIEVCSVMRRRSEAFTPHFDCSLFQLCFDASMYSAASVFIAIIISLNSCVLSPFRLVRLAAMIPHRFRTRPRQSHIHASPAAAAAAEHRQ